MICKSITTILGLISILVSILYVMSTASEFYSTYNLASIRQRDGVWLYEQCLQPDFAIKLSQHSDACQQIKALFQKTPLQTALDKQFQNFVLYESVVQTFSLVIILVMIFFISIPPYLSIIERRERERLSFAALRSSHTPVASVMNKASSSGVMVRWRRSKDWGKV